MTAPSPSQSVKRTFEDAVAYVSSTAHDSVLHSLRTGEILIFLPPREASDGTKEKFGVERLGQMLVHPRLTRLQLVVDERVRRHGDDGNRVRDGVPSCEELASKAQPTRPNARTAALRTKAANFLQRMQ